jgi:hypothetical protein
MLKKNADVDMVGVQAIEGQAIYGGELLVKPMMKGDEMVLMEIHYAAGVGAPAHVRCVSASGRRRARRRGA